MPESPIPTPVATAPVSSGSRLGGRYELNTLLARGGMADVWLGTDLLLQRPVAIKILHPHLAEDSSFVARFRDEAIAVARLHHPAIVSIFDTCHENGTEAIIMELVQGRSLRQHLDARGVLSPEEVIRIGATIADALGAAHRAGLVHRDVKPANILLADDERILITDFGIAKMRDDTDRTHAGTMLGSVKYLSPEQVAGTDVDGRSDIYSLGVVLYEALTGRAPFVADTPAAVAVARLHGLPERPRTLRPTLPPRLDETVMRALAIDPSDRFADTSGFRMALVACRDSEPAVDPDATTVEPRPVVSEPIPANPTGLSNGTPTRRYRKTRWGVAVTVMVLVAASVATAGILIARNEGRRPVSPIASPASSATRVIGITNANAFDPLGDGREVDDATAAAIDADPSSAWRTEMYDTRDFNKGRLKAGVGLALTLDRTAPISSVTVSSPTKDWSAQVYVSDREGTSLGDWGPPIAEATGISGDATFDLHSAEGGFVLVWITDLGAGPPRVFTQITNVAVSGG